MKITFVFAFIVFFAGITNAQNNTAVTERLDSLFEKTFKPGQPGAAVIIVKNGRVMYEKGFGVEDMQTKKRITSKNTF